MQFTIPFGSYYCVFDAPLDPVGNLQAFSCSLASGLQPRLLISFWQPFLAPMEPAESDM